MSPPIKVIQGELLPYSLTGLKRIERDSIDPKRVFKPRHETKKRSTLNIRECL